MYEEYYYWFGEQTYLYLIEGACIAGCVEDLSCKVDAIFGGNLPLIITEPIVVRNTALTSEEAPESSEIEFDDLPTLGLYDLDYYSDTNSDPEKHDDQHFDEEMNIDLDDLDFLSAIGSEPGMGLNNASFSELGDW